MRLALSILLCSCLLAPAARADDATPGSADWGLLDLEGKWVAYRAAIAKDSQVKGAWMTWLHTTKDHELLEMIAVYEGWQAPGPLLVQAKAPQWIRAAFWALDEHRSHSFDDAAARLLSANPGDVLEWARRHPDGLTKTGNDLVRKIREAHPKAEPNESLEALPPLRASEVFRALSAPPKLLEFGARKTAQPGESYLHQVVRAIRGRVRHRPLNASVRDQLLGLARHPHATVRRESVVAFASLGSHLRPVRALYYTANDEREPIGVREAAARVAAGAGHPAIRAWLLDVVYRPAHPLWIAALSELVDRGTFYLLHDDAFAVLKPTDPARQSVLRSKMRALRQAWREADRPKWGSALKDEFVLAAWMNRSGHARAKEYAFWLVTLARDRGDRPGVHKTVLGLAGNTKLAPVLPFAPGASIVPTSAEIAAEVQLLARKALRVTVPSSDEGR